MNITIGLALMYNGFGSNVGTEYIVTKTNDKTTTLNGKVYGTPSSFPIRTADLKEGIEEGIYVVMKKA